MNEAMADHRRTRRGRGEHRWEARAAATRGISGAVALAAPVAAMALLAGVAEARSGGSWRCGSRLILPGMVQEQVLELCGEPDGRTTSEERRTRWNGAGEKVVEIVPVETWTYDRGSNQLVRLTFRNGNLTRIKTGDYGR